MRRAPLKERFYEKVALPNADGCMEWQGYIHPDGYGMFNDGQPTQAHRVSYRLMVGPLDGIRVIDHLCRNRACVAPDHLRQVPQVENVRVGDAMLLGKTCKNGHSLADARIYIRDGRTNQICVPCETERKRQWRRERKSRGD